MNDLEHIAGLAIECIDQDGNAQPSPELIQALAALGYEQRARMWYALGVARGSRIRMRPLPPEEMVGSEIFRMLGRLAASPSAVDVLERVLHEAG